MVNIVCRIRRRYNFKFRLVCTMVHAVVRTIVSRILTYSAIIFCWLVLVSFLLPPSVVVGFCGFALLPCGPRRNSLVVNCGAGHVVVGLIRVFLLAV